MNKESIKEKLKYYNSLKNAFWATFVVLTGSLCNLSMNLKNLYETSLLYIGWFFDFILILVFGICIAKVSIYIKMLDRRENYE